MHRVLKKSILTFALLMALALQAVGKSYTDTLLTDSGDKVLVTWTIAQTGNRATVSVGPRDVRIIPSDKLKSKIGGKTDRVKAIVFDRVGDFSVKFTGEMPKAFMFPSSVSGKYSSEGFYILGENSEISFTLSGEKPVTMDLPVFIGVSENRQTSYRLVSRTVKPLKIVLNSSSEINSSREGYRKNESAENVAKSGTDISGEDEEAILDCIDAIMERLPMETELPFSQYIMDEKSDLRSYKRKVQDRSLLQKIERTLRSIDDKEQELKDAKAAAVKAEQARVEQERKEELMRQQEAEEKAREEAEKQQKRSLLMVVGGIVSAVFCFVFSTVFRHFRDVKNQKSMMDMQQNIARQAEHEAKRRARQVVDNKTRQVVNTARSKARTSVRTAVGSATEKAKSSGRSLQGGKSSGMKSI